MEQSRKRCSCCGITMDDDVEWGALGVQILCPECLVSRTVICEDCGRRIWNDDNYRTYSEPLCVNCRDAHYVYCINCDRLIHEANAFYHDDDEPLCESCYESAQAERVIHGYNYKPEPIFYGDGERYFGVELEIDGAGESVRNAEKILNCVNANDPLIYIKHDGSLNEGFEIVTHPMSLEFHMTNMPWANVMDIVKNLGYLSHQAKTCGLHVHVNRDAFGADAKEQDEVISRILFFVEKHWNELLIFSRRTPQQLERWAARYGYKDNPKEMLAAAKDYHYGRYTCINLTNDSTIEFRIFRGTLKLNTLIATLQMVDRICDVAFRLSDDEVKDMSWSVFVSSCNQPELIQYLKERRLYINDPISAEREV